MTRSYLNVLNEKTKPKGKSYDIKVKEPDDESFDDVLADLDDMVEDIIENDHEKPKPVINNHKTDNMERVNEVTENPSRIEEHKSDSNPAGSDTNTDVNPIPTNNDTVIIKDTKKDILNVSEKNIREQSTETVVTKREKLNVNNDGNLESSENHKENENERDIIEEDNSSTNRLIGFGAILCLALIAGYIYRNRKEIAKRLAK